MRQHTKKLIIISRLPASYYLHYRYFALSIRDKLIPIAGEEVNASVVVLGEFFYGEFLFDQNGGGVKVAPEAEMDDGKLDAYLIESVSPSPKSNTTPPPPRCGRAISSPFGSGINRLPPHPI